MARRPSALPPPQPAKLTVDEMKRGIGRLHKRIADLEAFDPQSIQRRFAPEVTALETSIEETLAGVFGHNTVDYKRYRDAASLDNGPISMATEVDWLTARGLPERPVPFQQNLAEGKRQAILLLQQAIRGLEEEISDREDSSASATSATTIDAAPALDLSKVFLVHGHDGTFKAEVARFIQKLGFEPIILHERPNKGRTLITKFREEAAGAGFAVVLMTPDDLGKAENAGDLNRRARQNVVFELGFFVGKLGPERVAALVKGDIEKPSDFDGVVYISLDKGSWQNELGVELQEAGYNIDWNKVMKR